MDLLGYPLLFHPAWVCLLVGGIMLTMAIRDSRFGETRRAKQVAVAVLAVGVAFAAATIYFSLQPAPTTY